MGINSDAGDSSEGTLRDDVFWMQKALALADRASELGEVPVGAVVVDAEQRVVGEGFNCPISGNDPTAHAEMVAMRAAAQALGNYRLSGCTLYVTIEPCTMCAGAMVHARIQRLVYGALEPKAGAVTSNGSALDRDNLNHRVDWTGGVLASECSDTMSRFFSRRREEKRAQKLAAQAANSGAGEPKT